MKLPLAAISIYIYKLNLQLISWFPGFHCTRETTIADEDSDVQCMLGSDLDFFLELVFLLSINMYQTVNIVFRAL